MDIWGLGCVFFEVLSLYPLFPGTNELDQVQKIHQIMGTPSAELLNHFKKKSSHMDFNFPPTEGTGIEKMIPHIAADCVDLIQKLLAYNPDERLSARQGLRHPWFRDLREAEKRGQATAKTMSPAPLSPAPSQSSVVTAKSNDTKVSKAPTREGKSKDDGLPSISKADSKKHSSVDSNSGGHDSQLLPPIGKPVSLMIDSTKKMHKTQPKPAPTLQQKTKHSQMVAASRRKKDDRISGLAVYSKTSMTDTSRSGAK
jgi:renal tumor antigen